MDLHPHFAELDRSLASAIRRGPRDRLHSREDVRRDWAQTMATTMGLSLVEERLLVSVPVQACLWTDPVLFRHRHAWLVLDHPASANEPEWPLRLLSQRVGVHDCPRWWSLYENRYPRLITVSDRQRVLPASDLLNRLGPDWHGPFEAPPTWETVPGALGPMRGMVRVVHPVRSDWMTH